MRQSVYRWFEGHVWAGDAIPGFVLLIALSINARAIAYTQPAAVPLLIVSAAPMFVRRSFTRFAVVLTVVLLTLNLGVFTEPTFAVVLAPVMVHAAVAHISARVWGRTALALGLIGAVLAPARWGYADSSGTVFALAFGLCAVSVVAAFVIGERQRDQVEHQADQLASVRERARMEEAERDQRASLAAATERARIARELHDIVAHSLSVVIVQADGAAAAGSDRPELAQAALQTIAGTSREALAEMRRLVGVLRSGTGPDPADDSSYVPAQGVRELPALVEQMNDSGVTVELRTTGIPRTLSAGLDLTVYRVVQESLTNVLRHAGPGALAQVSIDYREGDLQLSVTDDGRGGAVERGQGHGLLGMQERVWLQGGVLTVGPATGGGFRVQAILPIPVGA